MTKQIEEILKVLNQNLLDDDFVNICEQEIAQIDELDNNIDSVQDILILMEENPSVDFGAPGPLVRFVECFFKKGYEDKLIDSLNRKPTHHTLWMFNRILNGVSGEEKAFLFSVLENIIQRNDINTSVLELAKEFRDLHI